MRNPNSLLNMSRYIKQRNTLKLSDSPIKTSVPILDLSGVNTALLNNLSIDNYNRFVFKDDLLAVPLHQEDW